MVAVTFGGERVAAPAIVDAATGKKAKSFFTRVFNAIAASQMKRAERELARYRYMLPHDFELTRGQLWVRHEDEPFGGW